MPATDRTPARSQLAAVTIQESLDALRRAAAATGERLGSISDSHADVPVRGLAWSVAETAAHLVALVRQSAAFTSGTRDGAAERAALPPSGGIGERMALGNARELAGLGERRIPVLRQVLESSLDEYATLIARRGDGGPVETLSGLEDPASMTAALVGEQLVHGFDLARAVGRRWTIDPCAARLTLSGVAPSCRTWWTPRPPAASRTHRGADRRQPAVHAGPGPRPGRGRAGRRALRLLDPGPARPVPAHRIRPGEPVAPVAAAPDTSRRPAALDRGAAGQLHDQRLSPVPLGWAGLLCRGRGTCCQAR
jgi:hypothetical protein